MLTLFYTPGACSMAAHVVLEESGEKYDGQRVDLAAGEQRSEAYLKINPQGRVPSLRLDSGEAISRLLRLGRAPRIAGGRTHPLHGVQGPDTRPPGSATDG